MRTRSKRADGQFTYGGFRAFHGYDIILVSFFEMSVFF